MNILAIDPGPTKSAYMLLVDGKPERFGLIPNAELLTCLSAHRSDAPALVIEKIESYGMPVGVEVFETVRWSGRFEQAYLGATGIEAVYLPRRTVKLHLCGSSRAKDANVHQALLDIFGGKESAVGRKASPGPLYGIKADIWSALAIAYTWETLPRQTEIGV